MFEEAAEETEALGAERRGDGATTTVRDRLQTMAAGQEGAVLTEPSTDGQQV